MKKQKIAALLAVCVATCLSSAVIGCKGKTEEPAKPETPAPVECECEHNEQGLAFYPQDDGTFAVGVGSGSRLSKIVVPDKYMDKDVTAVAEYGFSGANASSVTLPASVKNVYEHAFDGCKNLDTVVYGTKEVGTSDLVSVNGKVSWAEEGLTIGSYAFENTKFMSVNLEDSADNDTIVNCHIDSRIEGSTVKVSAAINDVTDRVATTAIPYHEVKKDFDVNFGTYGEFKKISVEVDCGNDKKLTVSGVPSVSVTADEYVLAPLSASYPVLVFSLKMKDISDNYTIPTFVGLERTSQYDWSKLPQNVYTIPNVVSGQAIANDNKAYAEYIKELYKLNTRSKFHLYITDTMPEVILQMFHANNIPTENWDAVMLSDGVGSAGNLSTTYNVDDPDALYAKMKTEWNTLKAAVTKSGYSTETIYDKITLPRDDTGYAIMSKYAFVVANEESNVSWWVNRFRPSENLSAIKAEFVTKIQKAAIEYNTNALLKALDDNEQAAFKQLYKFNDNMFEDAEKQHKDVIMILGTDWNNENGNLYDYIKMTVAMYGTTDYVYYYKGHPGYPTSLYPGRQQYFDDLADEGYEIHELDNAIAAEIILFYKPDVYMVGYRTSTFDSAESQDKALLVFASKEACASETYKKLFDSFASKIADNDAFTSSHSGISLESDRTYYLIEFNNTEEYPTQVANYNKHEIAIYDTVEKTIKYYKNDGGSSYREVNANGENV